MNSIHEPLRNALKRMPVPPPRPGFVDAALKRATSASSPQPRELQVLRPFALWQTWMGAAMGATAAVLVTAILMTTGLLRPTTPDTSSPGIYLAVNEARTIEVLIDSERMLDDATIRIATTGPVELDGLDDKREVHWQTRLERGRNVLSLPVVARSEGNAQLVAIIEHAGRTRRVAVQLTVKQTSRNEVA